MQKLKSVIMLTSPLHTGKEQGKVAPEQIPEGAKKNYTPHRRMPLLLKYGEYDAIVDVPTVSGNSIRHALREFLVDPTLDRLGLARKDLDANILELLVSGGGMDISDAKKEKAEKTKTKGNFPILVRNRETLMSMLPPLALFGASYGNRMLKGLVGVSFLTPAFKETKYLTGYDSSISYTNDIMSFQLGTRHDPVSDKEDHVSRQGIYYFETVASGVPFAHDITLRNATKVERGALQLALNRFKEEGYLGGKNNLGLGQFEMIEDYDKVGEIADYYAFLDENKDAILEYINIFNNPKEVAKDGGNSIEFPEGLTKELDRIVHEREEELKKNNSERFRSMA